MNLIQVYCRYSITSFSFSKFNVFFQLFYLNLSNSIFFDEKGCDFFPKYSCLSIHVERHVWYLSGRYVLYVLKFCKSGKFITKDFALMNSNIKRIHSYVHKYHHFVVKFQHYSELPNARTIYVHFWQEKKLYLYMEFFLPRNSRGWSG